MGFILGLGGAVILGLKLRWGDPALWDPIKAAAVAGGTNGNGGGWGMLSNPGLMGGPIKDPGGKPTTA